MMPSDSSRTVENLAILSKRRGFSVVFGVVVLRPKDCFFLQALSLFAVFPVLLGRKSSDVQRLFKAWAN